MNVTSETATPTDTNATNDVEAPAAPTPDARSQQPDRLVPVTESIRYRKRAQAAEQQLGELQGKLSQVESELTATRQTIATLERRQKIDALLSDAEAVDVEVARLLTEAAVEVMEQPDVARAIEELRRSKPYLFRRRTTAAQAGAMPARTRGDVAATTDEAAQTAATSGDRRDLLTYLRLRRNGRHAISA